ncbi:MAG: transposase [Saprospiraceae bacterium]
MLEKIKHIDPTKITADAAVQNLLVTCMNLLEHQASIIDKQAKEIQELKDEINRLKGEHGSLPPRQKRKIHAGQKTKIKAKRPARSKASKKAKLVIDELVHCQIDKSVLPEDAVLHRYDELIQQDVVFKRQNTLFRVPVYYSKSARQTYRGILPESYHGQFGKRLESVVQLFHHYCDMTQSRLQLLLKNIGIQISTGKIDQILLSNRATMEQETEQILLHGLSRIPYTQMDGTKSTECGQSKATQIICTEYYTVYQTMSSKCRAHVIGALQGRRGDDVPLRYDQKGVLDLAHSKVPKKDQRLLAELLTVDKVYTITELEELLKSKAAHLLLKKSHADVLAILATRYYLTQDKFPVVQTLLTDAGHEYGGIAANQALCWIHEDRHFKKMVPKLEVNQQILEQFRCQLWTFYKKLLNFKELDQTQQAQQQIVLTQEFDKIFTQKTDYHALNKEIEKTLRRKEKLLQVLHLPSLPLHNNQAELAVRRKVRKRDISLHTMSVHGTAAQDAFMSVVETAAKLGVNALDYLYDRLSGNYAMKPLAELIFSKTN